MKNFNSLYSILIESLLLEAIGKTDIVDLYIILSLPQLSDPAHAFVAQEIVNETSGRIISECEHVVLRELRHFNEQSQLGTLENETNGFKAIARIKDPEEYDCWDDFIDEYTEETGTDIGLPPLTPQTAMYWANFATSLKKAGQYLRSQANNKKSEMSLAALNKASGYNFTFGFIARLFDHGGWDESYGGEAWAAVAIAVDNLKTANKSKFIFYLDRLVDLVHNTGSVLNKFKAYKQGWLTYILDLKQHAINLNELIPYASPEVRKLFTSPDWRLFKMKMPSGNETSGIERILSKVLIKFYKNTSNWSMYFGDIMDLILHTKYNLIEGLMNLYSHSDDATRKKLNLTFKKMLDYTTKNNNPKIFFTPTKNQLLRFADHGELFMHGEEDMDDYTRHWSQKELMEKTKRLLKFMYDGSKAVGFNTDAYLKAKLKKAEKEGMGDDDWF